MYIHTLAAAATRRDVDSSSRHKNNVKAKQSVCKYKQRILKCEREHKKKKLEINKRHSGSQKNCISIYTEFLAGGNLINFTFAFAIA